MNGECAFEGMHGGAGPKTQRRIFWTAVLSGAPGHAYGSDSMWQMNRRGQPFGPSSSGHTWGNSPWEEAMHWEGSCHVGVGRRVVERLGDWWRVEPRTGWVTPALEENPNVGAVAAEIPDDCRLYYFPSVTPWLQHTLTQLDAHGRYRATWYSPLDGQQYDAGIVTANEQGVAPRPAAPILHDWVLALRPVRHRSRTRGRITSRRNTRT
jgi:Protein of unknown function (DUF4038)